MEGFVAKRHLVFKPPLKHLLRGFAFEGSSFNKDSFYVCAFVMPLCVPKEHLSFTFGDRVRDLNGADRWNVGMPNLIENLSAALKRDAVTFISRIESVSDFIGYAKSGPRTLRNLEGVGYSLARNGQISEACAIFDELLAMVDLSNSWQRELAGEVNRLKDVLTQAPENVRAQLAASESETIHKLGLYEFRDA